MRNFNLAGNNNSSSKFLQIPMTQSNIIAVV